MTDDHEAFLCESCGAPVLSCRKGNDVWWKCSGCKAEFKLGPALVAALDAAKGKSA